MGRGEQTGQNVGENTGASGRILIAGQSLVASGASTIPAFASSGSIVDPSNAARNPTYTPLAALDYQGGTLGSDPATGGDWVTCATPAKCLYNDDITGPWGSSKVIRQSNTVGKYNFGGRLLQFSPKLDEGDELWIRNYFYIPTGFCFGQNNSGGNQKIKWYRLWYDSNTSIVFQHYASCCGSSNCHTPGWKGPTGEGYLFLGSGGNEIINVNASANSYAYDTWSALQIYVKFSATIGVSRMCMWVDDTNVLDTTSYRTLNNGDPSGWDSGSCYKVDLGTYWNNAWPADQEFYLAETIITTDRPNTQDSGGRYYIHPDTRVSDF